MTLVIKKLDNQEIGNFIDLIRIFENVFEMKSFEMPDKNYLQKLLANNGFFVLVALLNGKVIGGLTAYTLQQYYCEFSLLYIYDLAVKTQYQRQGIGKMLIACTRDYCKGTGIEEMFVQADEEDNEAIQFYHSTGATAEKVVHFYYLLK